MGRKNLNVDTPAPRQVWEHYKTGHQLLILQIVHESALCALMDTARVTKNRVIVPLDKFKFWGNRGMFLVGKRTGKLPSLGTNAGAYNTRNAGLGAR